MELSQLNTSSPAVLDLFLFWTPDSDPERQDEYCVTLRLNAANPQVRSIRLVALMPLTAPLEVACGSTALAPAPLRAKVSIVLRRNLTIGTILREASSFASRTSLCVFLNSDIVVGDWSLLQLGCLAKMSRERAMFALSRYEPRNCFPGLDGLPRVHRSRRTTYGNGREGLILAAPHKSTYTSMCPSPYMVKRSRDALAFNTALSESTLSQLDFEANHMGSENLLSCKLTHAGHWLRNPCNQLPIYHNHCSDQRHNMSGTRIDIGHRPSCAGHQIRWSALKDYCPILPSNASMELNQIHQVSTATEATSPTSRLVALLCARQRPSASGTPDLLRGSNITRKCCVKGRQRPALHFHATSRGTGWGGGGSQLMQAFQRALDALSVGHESDLAARHVLNAGSHGKLINESTAGCAATPATVIGANMLLVRNFVPLSCWFKPQPCQTGYANANIATASLPNTSRFEFAVRLAAKWLKPNARLRAEIARLRSHVATAYPALRMREADVGLHLRRGDRQSQQGEERMDIWSARRVADAIKKGTGAGGGLNESRPILVLAMTDDRQALEEVQHELPQHFVLASLEDIRASMDPMMQPLDFIFSALWLLTEAGMLLANSHSNLGSLLFTLAGARRSELPAIIDFDDIWSREKMLRGAFPCDVQWGPRKGLCIGVGSRRSALDEAGGRNRKKAPSHGW